MPKLISSLSCLFLLVSLLLPATPVQATEPSVLDQSCDDAMINLVVPYGTTITTQPLMGQFFTPQLNRLNKISLAMYPVYGAVNPSLNLKLYGPDGALLLNLDRTPSFNNNSVWMDFAFPTLNVEPGRQYKIVLTGTNNSYKWLMSNRGCYAGGASYLRDTTMTYVGYGFKTYGYNVVANPDQPSLKIAAPAADDPSAALTDPDTATAASQSGISLELVLLITGIVMLAIAVPVVLSRFRKHTVRHKARKVVYHRKKRRASKGRPRA